MSNLERPSLGARVGGVVSRVYPKLNDDVWHFQRRRHTRAQVLELEQAISALPNFSMSPERPIHLIVCAHHGPDAHNWHPGGGNLFFEVYQSAVEILGPDNVTLFGVASDETETSWHRRFLSTLGRTQATHVIAQIENDPNQANNWSWDVIATILEAKWDGVLIAMMYDSAFHWLRLRTRRLGKLFSRMLIGDICEPMDDFIRKGQPEVGPITMPWSQASVDAVEAYVAGKPKKYDVTFIGALYDYRAELIEQLRASGFEVAVNPHRADETKTYDESRANQPTYLDYMAGLAQSELTINFSLASGGPHEQYKIRVQEASLVGCICLTDDKERSRLFFAPNEYAYFESISKLNAVVTQRLADREKLRRDQADARARAHELAKYDFWGRIEDGLVARGLRPLTNVKPPVLPRSVAS
jgi:hypothetical protein